MSDDAVLAFDGAAVRVEGRTILGPLSMAVRAGEHWAVLGPNGGGKTTLLSLAGAWSQPTEGTVRVVGAELGGVDVRALRARIGHVSHAVAERLRPRLSVLDVVLTGKASVLETWWQPIDAADRDRALGTLADVGCETLAGRPLATCSLGERQRVLIARALFGDHELLLLDEPAAGLDLPARESLIHAMRAAAARPRPPTMVLATHHLEELPPVVTHAALLREGRLLAAGPVEDVLRDEPLTACYGIGVIVERRAGRWWARAR
jgi:iron complex transport system ATP-binding protein